jgi:enamine deaminase RidA (YjgF/YER057c/UK114 family)
LLNLKGVLEAAGASMHDIVMLRIYTMDVPGFDKTAKIRNELFGGYHPPATLIVVKGLYGLGTVIEIEAIAVVD